MRYLLVAVLAGAALVSIAFADQVVTLTHTYDSATVVGCDDDMLVFRHDGAVVAPDEMPLCKVANISLDGHPRFNAAEKLYSSKKYAKAERAYKALLSQSPDGWLLRLVAERISQCKAVEYLNKAVALYEDDDPRVRSQALRLIQLAANKGNAEAAYRLALIYFKGDSVRQNEQAGMRWLRKAAERGSASALYDLGTGLLYGAGLERQPREAFPLLLEAAQQGHVYASVHVARCYEEGLGIASDRSKAMEWSKRAALGSLNNCEFTITFLRRQQGGPGDELALWQTRAVISKTTADLVDTCAANLPLLKDDQAWQLAVVNAKTVAVCADLVVQSELTRRHHMIAPDGDPRIAALMRQQKQKAIDDWPAHCRDTLTAISRVREEWASDSRQEKADR